MKDEKLKYLGLLLLIAFVDTVAFSESEKSPLRLSEELGQLYVQRVVNKVTKKNEETNEDEISLENSRFITVSLGFNLFQGALVNKDLFQVNRKYRIYISKDKETKPHYWIEVLIGGRQQFAFYFPDEAEPLVGALGDVLFKDEDKEFKLFVGMRDDPHFFDKEGFEEFWTDFCVPSSGLRCDGGEVTDYHEVLNSAFIVVQIPILFLTDNENIDEGAFSVWAKVFEAK